LILPSNYLNLNRVAPEFLQGTKQDAVYDTDEAPLIVFINARSGGRVGPELAGVLARALGRSQVRCKCHYPGSCFHSFAVSGLC
jgi:hypothetical protein